MKYKWLNKQNNKKLIIFFNGLGMDENVVKHLDTEDYDVVMFYDYNDLETDFVIEEYEEKYLVAWSMGVMIATNFDFKLNSATAINGTLKPIDAEYGINPRVYELTIRGFKSDRFVQNMFDGSDDITPPQPSPSREGVYPNRDAENQKSELVAIKSYSANENFKYNRVLISDNDKIIPTKSQCAYWGIEPNLKSGHCPFLLFKKWSELL